MSKKRVVITGIGLVTSLGDSPKGVINSVLNDRVNFLVSGDDPELIICPVRDFQLKSYISSYKYIRYLPKSWQFGLASAKMAIESAGLSDEDLKQGGLFVGIGPNVEVINDNVLEKALGLVSILPNTLCFCISHLFGIHGENLTISNACASSLQAIGEGFLRIRNGELKLALCGGSDSRIGKYGLKLYKNARVLLKNNKLLDPCFQYGPFDSKNGGFVPGEGGAFLVLEDMEMAILRGAEVFGEVIGYSSSLDGINPTAPDTSAKWAGLCVKRAIEMAGLDPGDIDVIFAHGTGTVLNDTMEINLIKDLFSRKCPYVSSIKSWIGHLASSCGAAEMAIGIICLKKGLVPRIRNLENPRDGEINFLPKDLYGEFTNAIFQSFGFGGQNAALIVSTGQ